MGIIFIGYIQLKLQIVKGVGLLTLHPSLFVIMLTYFVHGI